MINQLHTNCRDCAFAKKNLELKFWKPMMRMAKSFTLSMIEFVSTIEVKNGQRSILLPNLRTL
jgi:hypothetical protein